MFFFFLLDEVTLLGESIFDRRFDDIDDCIRHSSNFDNDYEFNNDDTITANYTKQQQRASFLHDSTHTLYSQDVFSAYTDDGEEDNKQKSGFAIRSNSLSIIQLDEKSKFVDKAPKKVVHFADVMVRS